MTQGSASDNVTTAAVRPSIAKAYLSASRSPTLPGRFRAPRPRSRTQARNRFFATSAIDAPKPKCRITGATPKCYQNPPGR